MPKVLTQFEQDTHDALLKVDRKAAERYARCGEISDWSLYCGYCESSGETFHAKPIPHNCMLRICPACAQKLAAPIRDRYRPLIEHLYNVRPHKGYLLVHWTLTRSKSIDDPDATMQETLNMARDWARELVTCHEFGGAIFAGELGETSHHYHAHGLVYAPRIDQKVASKVWREISGGDYIVYVKTFSSADAAIAEGLKYVIKPGKLSPEQLVKLHVNLKGTRRVRAYGIFFKSKNNPYSKWLDVEKTRCTCPDCGGGLGVVRNDDLNRMIVARGIYEDNIVQACRQLALFNAAVADQDARYLHLKETINFLRAPP